MDARTPLIGHAAAKRCARDRLHVAGISVFALAGFIADGL
jgi:hypothetical protein